MGGRSESERGNSTETFSGDNNIGPSIGNYIQQIIYEKTFHNASIGYVKRYSILFCASEVIGAKRPDCNFATAQLRVFQGLEKYRA